MAIIRFRTRIEDPRDVLFLFAALSTGLAIGVYGFTISFAGTALFCIVAWILHASPFRSFAQNHRLYFTVPGPESLSQVLGILEKYAREFRQISVQYNREGQVRYEYALALKRDHSSDHLIEHLRNVEGIKQLKIILTEFVNEP
ncbi:MAG TPA: hypothetical protein VEB86_16370, partial [Chryseosolibacter sp.]|nr:hypothetical protein [Chryseosolibacter sp.]